MNRSSRNMNPMNNMMMNNGSGNMGMGMGMSMNRSSRNMNPMNGSMNRNSSPNSQRKPPLISSQPQRSPNGAGAGSVGRGGRAPRSQFPQQRPTRRPQTRNMYPSYQQ